MRMGIDLEDKNGSNVMMQVIKDRKPDALAFLLNHGGRLDSRNSTEISMLSVAAAAGDVELMRRIVDVGVPVDAADQKGMTALHHAAECGELDAIQMLVQHKAVMDRPDNDGRNAAMFAARSAKLEMVKWLYDQKTNFSASDHAGNTLLMYAAQASDAEIMEFVASKIMAEHPHLLNARNSQGDTALIVGEKNYVEADSDGKPGSNQLDRMSMLIEYGADTSLKNNQGDGFLSVVQRTWRNAIDAPLTDKKARRTLALCIHFAPQTATPFQGVIDASQTVATHREIEDRQALTDLYAPAGIKSVFAVSEKLADELEETFTDES